MLLTIQGVVHRYPLLGGIGYSTSPFAQGKPCTMFDIAPDASHALIGIDAKSPFYVAVMPLDGSPPSVGTVLADNEPIHLLVSAAYVMNVGQDLLWVSLAPLGSPFNTSRLRGEKSHLGHVMPNQEMVFVCDGEGLFELRPLEAPGLVWWNKMSQVNVTAAAMGSDQKTIITGNNRGLVFLFSMPEAPVIAGLDAMQQLQALLEAKQYAALESLAHAVERETAPLSWQANESPIATLDRLLLYSPGTPFLSFDVEVTLKDWIAARPESEYPKVLLAEYYIRRGFAARGGGYANTVTADGWRGLRENISKAEELLIPICDRQTPPPKAYKLLMSVAMAQSWPRDRWQPYADRLLKEYPGYIDAHAQIMIMLMPRW